MWRNGNRGPVPNPSEVPLRIPMNTMAPCIAEGVIHEVLTFPMPKQDENGLTNTKP